MPEALVCQTEWSVAAAVVHLSGPLRVDTAPALRAAVHKCLAAEPRAVIVDTTGVDRLDDLAVVALATLARAAAAWPGIELIVLAPDRAVRDRLAAMAVSRYLPVAADRDQALALAGAGPFPTVAKQALPAGPNAVTEAREIVRGQCMQRGLDALAEAAEVITSELVGNAILHACPPYLFAVRMRGRFLHLSVRDGAATAVRSGAEPSSGTGGRGLLLVDSLATAWGVTPTGDGKIVWATLALRPGVS